MAAHEPRQQAGWLGPVRGDEDVIVAGARLHPGPEVDLRPEVAGDEGVVLRVEPRARTLVGLEAAEALAPRHGARRAELLDEDVLVAGARVGRRPDLHRLLELPAHEYVARRVDRDALGLVDADAAEG